MCVGEGECVRREECGSAYRHSQEAKDLKYVYLSREEGRTKRGDWYETPTARDRRGHKTQQKPALTVDTSQGKGHLEASRHLSDTATSFDVSPPGRQTPRKGERGPPRRDVSVTDTKTQRGVHSPGTGRPGSTTGDSRRVPLDFVPRLRWCRSSHRGPVTGVHGRRPGHRTEYRRSVVRDVDSESLV